MDEFDQASSGDKLAANGNGSFRVEEEREGLHPAVDIDRLQEEEDEV